jgi:hypothetical protein
MRYELSDSITNHPYDEQDDDRHRGAHRRSPFKSALRDAGLVFSRCRHSLIRKRPINKTTTTITPPIKPTIAAIIIHIKRANDARVTTRSVANPLFRHEGGERNDDNDDRKLIWSLP